MSKPDSSEARLPGSGGRRRWPRHLIAAGLSASLFLFVLEVILWVMPPRLNPRFGNYVYTTYNSLPGGIYFVDKETGVNFFRPSFETSNYWNGYTWTHQADRWGFRNRSGLEDKRILILGDSFLYGHGVEIEQTAVDLLRTRYRRPAYNMARQGDALYQHYILLRLFLDRFDPERVVLFVFLNDPDDLRVYRSELEILNPPELAEYDFEAIAHRVGRGGAHYGLRAELRRSRALKLLHGLFSELVRAPWLARAEAGADGPAGPVPRHVATILDDTAFSTSARYYRMILADLAERCRARGTELLLVHLEVREGSDEAIRGAQERLQTLLRETAAANSLELFTTAGLFAGCPDCFLAGDGHLSPEGNERLAEYLDRVVLASTPSL